MGDEKGGTRGSKLSLFFVAQKETKMYTERNFKTKKALKEAVAKGEQVRLFAPGIGLPKVNGTAFVSGPHYPEPHKWYAQVEVRDSVVVSVK